MKKLLFIVVSLAFQACQPLSPTTIITNDNRPKFQKGLINKLHLIDSIYGAAQNELVKKDIIDSGILNITQYVRDTTKFHFDNWQAFVNEIEVKKWQGEQFILVELVFSKDTSLFDPYQSIVFSAGVAFKERQLKTALKSLNKGDKVFISGIFAPETDNVTPHMRKEDIKLELSDHGIGIDGNIFHNPEFSIFLNKITKIESGNNSIADTTYHK